LQPGENQLFNIFQILFHKFCFSKKGNYIQKADIQFIQKLCIFKTLSIVQQAFLGFGSWNQRAGLDNLHRKPGAVDFTIQSRVFCNQIDPSKCNFCIIC